MPEGHDDSTRGQASPDRNDLPCLIFSSIGVKAVISPSNIYTREASHLLKGANAYCSKKTGTLCSLQDHLRTGTHNLDHPVSYRCKKHGQLVHQKVGFAVCFSSRCSDGEHLTCSGFSLGETVLLGNFEFITDYFGSMNLSPRGVMHAPFSWAQLVAEHC
jgi:hypothetical protein